MVSRALDERQGVRSRYEQLLELAHPYEPYLLAVLIFAASRIVVFLGLRFGRLLVEVRREGIWDAGPSWYHRLLRWDSGWYASIVDGGYQHSPDPSALTTAAFFPVYPAVAYLMKYTFGIDAWVALLLVANISALIAILLFMKVVKDLFGNEVALLSVALFSFFPSTVFLSAGYTESLCLVFVLASFLFLRRPNFLIASVFAGFALGTRAQGIVLIPVIWWEIVRQERFLSMLPKIVTYTVLAASGIIAYMIFLAVRFDDPLAFLTSQKSWHPGSLLERVFAALTLANLHKMSLTNSGALLAFAAIAAWSFRWLPSSFSLYALGSLAFPYLALSPTVATNRFVLMCFPVFICLGILCKRRAWITCVLIGLSAPMLLVYTALFSQWYWVY